MMQMPPKIQVYIDRVDALSLRERAMIFVAICAVIVGFVLNGLLDPSFARQKAYANTLTVQQQEIAALQVQFGALMQARARDARSLERPDYSAAKKKLAELERSIQERQREMVRSDRMAALLTELLRSSRNLEIQGMRSLAASPIETGAATGSQANPSSLYRHGLEMTVAGQYLDLLNYLAAIEKLPVKIFWGGMAIDASMYPRNVLKLTVYTLSPDKTWLQI
jgi:MSHA biogenesis protein MshJ